MGVDFWGWGAIYGSSIIHKAESNEVSENGNFLVPLDYSISYAVTIISENTREDTLDRYYPKRCQAKKNERTF